MLFQTRTERWLEENELNMAKNARWMMIEGPFPTNEPKGVLMNENMIDEKYKEEVLKLEIGEASPIYLHEGKELVFLRTQ
jgi:hypothetical protein